MRALAQLGDPSPFFGGYALNARCDLGSAGVVLGRWQADMGVSDAVEFRVLGPLEVLVDGRSVPLGAAKQRLVLAALLVGSNAVVSVDRLVDIVWGELPPDSAERTLQKYIYRLRGVIEPGRAPWDPTATLLTRPPGYLLELRPGQLDAARFTDLIGDARRRAAGGELAAAAALLDEALGLWRGPAWAEFAEFDFARAEVTRLEGQRAGATEDRAEIELALGHHVELVGELEATVARYPLRERSRAQLMLALYRSGRQAEALRAYHAFRSYLIDEIGLEPSAALQRLEDDILLNKADLEWTDTDEEASGLGPLSTDRPAPPAPVGTPRTGPLPAGTVTFCFTDIEGSTRLLRRLGHRYGEVLERHRQLLRGAMADHGGVEIHTDGDAMFFAFASATSALAACVAGQHALSEERWLEGISVLVRMGLHTGEASPEHGDYVALAVHQAARVVGAAHGGQILVSEATAAAVGEAIDPSTTVRDLGTHRLKDFERPTKLFQLCHPQLPDLFPPPRVTETLGLEPPSPAMHRGLPAPLERADIPLVGRAQDLEWLAVLWQRALAGERQLAIVSGEPGSGKTALVGAFARRLHALGAVVTYTSGKHLPDARPSLPEALWAALGQDGVDGPTRPDQSDGHSSAPTPEEIERRLVALAAEAPLLVALDDVECSDPASLAEFMGASPAGRGVLVLATVCEPDGDDGSPLDTGGVPPSSLHGPSSVHRRRLQGLGPDDVGVVLSHGGQPRSRELVEAVHAETAGNPALVLDAARRLREQDASARVERALARAEAARRDLSAAEEMAGDNILESGRLSKDRRPPGSAETRLLSSDVCPYKGLARFDVADAGYFCGRDRLVATLVARLAVARFVGVVGASGSGKSSLVRAGLLAALDAGTLPGSDTWPTVICTPGADPLGSLSSALAPVVRRSPAELRRLLEDNPEEFDGVVHAALDDDPEGRLVVVLDQFEELVTACRDRDARQRVVDVVINFTSEADSRIVVVAVLRADYYGAFAAHPELARLLEKSQVLVGAMTEAELRRAIIEPAGRAGLRVEAGLVEAVCRDAAGEPGALPLVSTALLETWVRRRDHTLTLAGYLEAGGVRGALARMAEDVYDGFDPPGQAVARRVFLRLAEPGRGHEDLRRRVPRSELALGPETDSVVDTLIERRLLAADGESVEVAHEALLREWPRLRAWLEEDRQGRHLHRQLTEGAVAWEAEGRDPSALYRGVRLAAASDWAAAHGEDANALEREFLDRSVAAQDRELRTTRRSARRLRYLAAGLAVVMVVALLAGGLALVQRSNAIHQAATADASRLASQAEVLADKNPDLSLLLAVEARRQQPSVATDGALEAALVRTPPGLDRVVHLDPGASPVVSFDGRLIIAPGQDGVVRLVAVASGRVVRTLPGKLRSDFPLVKFTRDGAWLAGGGRDGTVIVWNLRTGAREATIHVGGSNAEGTFAPWGAPSGDAARLVTASGDGSVSVWDLSDPTQPRRVGDAIRVPPFAGGVPLMEPSPDGSRVAIGEVGADQTFIFDLASHALQRQLPGVLAGFSPDGASLATALGNRIVMWDPATGQPRGAPLTGFSHPSPGVFFDTHGSLAAVGDLGDNSVRVFDLASGRQVGAAVDQAYPAGFTADGRLAVGTASGGTGGTSEIRLYRVGAQSIPPIATALQTRAGVPSKTTAFTNNENPYTMAKFALHGTEVITQGGSGAPLLAWQASTGRPLGPVLGGAVQAQHGFYPSPDGILLAVSQAGGRLEVWDLATRQRRAVVSAGNTSPSVAWMPSGRGLVTTNPGGKLEFWRVSESGHVTPRAHTTVESIAPGTRTDPIVSPDGRTVALISYSGGDTIPLLDTGSGRTLRSLPAGGVFSTAAFSPDSKTLAVFLVTTAAPLGDKLVVRDVATGAPRATQTVPYIEADRGLAFVRGGAWLVTTENGFSPEASPAPSRVDVWDAATLQPIGDPLTVPPDAAFPSPNRGGDKLGTGSDADNGLPLVWNMNPTSWEATACRIAGRNLSHAEWNEYLAGQPYRKTCPQWPAGD
jgi:class 3 adenylate cyclase/DNA-binding SARP family transcriptional activator/WD40 repeat protein